MGASLNLTVSKVADSASIDNNTSKVKIVLKITTNYGTWNETGDTSGSIAIDGASVASLKGKKVGLNTTTTLYSGTHTIKHDDDGSKSITVKASFDVNTATRWIYATKALALDTIPRATTIDSLTCATDYFTGKLTYKYTPKSSAMYNRCNVSLNLDGEYIPVRSHIDLGKKSAAQQTATVTLAADELETIYNQLPSTTKGTLRFTFRTYSDSGYSTQVGDAGYKEITLKIPDVTGTKPTVGMGLTPVHSLDDAFSALYIQGKTKVKVALDAVGKFKATIKSYSVKLNGVTTNTSATYTSGYLTQTGSLTVYGYATDSRGFTGSTSQKITVIPYSAPKILNVTAERCDENGNLTDSGTYLKIHAKRSYAKVLNGSTQTNFCAIRYRWKPDGGSYSSWTTILAKTATGDEVTTGALLGSLAVDTTYQVQVQAIDDIGDHAETVVTVPTEEVYAHRTKNALGLGKYAEGEKVLDVGWDAHFRGEVKIGDVTLREYILSIIEGG